MGVWPVKLFLGDLIEIDSVVRSVASDGVGLTVEEYQLDSIGELAELPMKTLRSVRWRSFSPDLAVHISNTGVTVEATGSDAGLRGAVEQIADVLREHHRPLFRYFVWSWPPAQIATIVCLVLSSTVSPLWMVPFLLCVVWCTAATRAWITRRSLIFSVLREERPSFWQRKRDDVLLLILGVTIGAVPTGLITYLATRAQK